MKRRKLELLQQTNSQVLENYYFLDQQHQLQPHLHSPRYYQLPHHLYDHHDNENKEEDLFEYDRIDIEEFKIELDDNIDKESSSLINSRNFVDFGESIKVEYINEEINEEESVEDPLLLKHN